MLPDSPPAAVPAPDLPASTPPGLIALFVAFAKVSLAGFGGVLVWARRGIVDQHRWMTADEFNETYALCHFLPGPNVVNLSVVFGSRFRGIPGSVAAFAGLLGPPVVIMTALAALYARYGEIDALRRILAGVSCAAVGLLLSAVFRMTMPLVKGAIWSRLCCWLPCLSPSGCCGCHCRQYCWWRSRSALRSALRCAGEFRHEFRLQPDFDAWLDIRPDVAVRGGRRECRHPGNAPDCSRCAALDDRQAICRCVRDLADVAGPERADRYLDRLYRRRGCRRARRNAGDVGSDRGACLLRQPPAHAIEPFALARHHSG